MMFIPIIIQGGRSRGGGGYDLSPPKPRDYSSAVIVKRRKLFRMMDLGIGLRRITVGEWWVLIDRITDLPIVKCKRPV